MTTPNPSAPRRVFTQPIQIRDEHGKPCGIVSGVVVGTIAEGYTIDAIDFVIRRKEKPAPPTTPPGRVDVA